MPRRSWLGLLPLLVYLCSVVVRSAEQQQEVDPDPFNHAWELELVLNGVSSALPFHRGDDDYLVLARTFLKEQGNRTDGTSVEGCNEAQDRYEKMRCTERRIVSVMCDIAQRSDDAREAAGLRIVQLWSFA